MTEKYVLGIDTSNYKTSVAIVDSRKNILCDLRKLLTVKQGERGLRQSDALFQHIMNLPEMIRELTCNFNGELSAIAYSSRPRPVEGSYMPVFNAGKSLAESIAAILDIPCFEFSHQEGHIEAVKAYSIFEKEKEVLSCHFSGGTTEILRVSEEITIYGGSEDIAFGQVIDRAGVAMGMAFPSGEYLDKYACMAEKSSKFLTKIKVKDCKLNLSGIDTQIKNFIKKHEEMMREESLRERSEFVREIFEKLAEAIGQMVIQASEKTGITKVIMAGGVSSSKYIKKRLDEILKNYYISVAFDKKGLSSDNAVGIALLGGKNIWG